MSSLDMVAYINSTREPGKPELRHDNFLAKVPTVLGPETSPEFLGHVEIALGQGAKRLSMVYNFPRREAMLMAMSYSYKLQATGCPFRPVRCVLALSCPGRVLAPPNA